MKIAIIGQIDHSLLGGIETYIFRLISLLKNDGHEVDEFITHPPKFYEHKPKVRERVDGVKLIDISGKTLLYPIKATRKIKKIIKSNEYDLIIHNSEPTVTEWMLKQENTIFVQHQEFKGKNKSEKTKSDRFKLFLDRTFLKLGYKGNFLNRAKNVVLFAKEESNSHAENKFYIPAFSNIDVSKTKTSKKNILWIGRLTEEKGAKRLPYINEKLKNNLLIYGDGECREFVENADLNYKGLATQNELTKIYDSSKVHIVTSLSEGFCLTIVEALSRGLPVVAWNKYASIDFFKKSSACFPVESIDELVKKADEIESMSTVEWEKISRKAIKFAQENFSIEVFTKKWKGVIKKWIK